ncbi:sugar phosphate isomerase/epimerase, partial [bacterium]|nr:sugar phosphate isomerase/epimerase [bacterium]
MKEMSRRSFLSKSITASAALGGLTLGKTEPSFARLQTTKNDISLAQWALNREIRKGMWNNLDFPKIAREVFDINGIEFVNSFFEAPTNQYLKRLKKNAENYNVTMVLIMVDGEGALGSSDKKER